MCCAHLSRRQFLGATTGMVAGASLLGATAGAATAPTWAADRWVPSRPIQIPSRPLRVLPVLMYRVPVPKEMSSWKSWGGVQSDEAAAEEARRISAELAGITAGYGVPLEVLPVVLVKSTDDTLQLAQHQRDVTIVYPATGSGETLRACIQDRNTILFTRHRSGPVYYWYEALSTRYLRPAGDVAVAPDDPRLLSVEDVVVDDPAELAWRLRALYGVANLQGARVLAVGGAMGKYAPDAPQIARERYKLDIVDLSYDDLAVRIQAALADPAQMQIAEQWAATYLALPETVLSTGRDYVVNAFILYGVFKDLMEEHGASLFTIQQCMSTIMPMSKTTACLTLSLMNDEGLGAFCESDFVIIPAGILLYYVAGKPVFQHNSTFPHGGVVTCAHCTGPRRMDGDRYEPVELLTHYESEFGAAPKVQMPVGQEVSFINPDYASPRWVGLKGSVVENPFYAICRSQQDVRVEGHWEKLLNEVRDSHWVMVYGDYLKQIGYAARHLGVAWDNISTV